MRFGLWLAAALLCAPAGAAYAENVLRWISAEDAQSLDPNAPATSSSVALIGQIYERLVTRDPDLAFAPELATDWRPVGENVWLFNLRQGVKFHDGAPFTAEDVVFSITRAKEGAALTNGAKTALEGVREVVAVGDLAVLIVTATPNPLLPNLMTHVYMLDSDADDATMAVAANGTGPFKLTERRQGEQTILSRSEDWWGSAVFPGNIDRLEYTPVQNGATRVAKLIEGESDLVLDPPAADLAAFVSEGGGKIGTAPSDQSVFLGVDLGAPALRSSNIRDTNPFADSRVRAAVNLAIDTDAIRDEVMAGLSRPSGMIVGPGVRGYTKEQDAPAGFDPEKARELMREAGFEDGFAVRLDCPDGAYQHDTLICQAVSRMLDQIGLDIEIDFLPPTQHMLKIENRLSDFYLFGWRPTDFDSASVLAELVQGGGPMNATQFNNARVNEVIETVAVITDEARRDGLVDEAWSIVKGESPYIPLHHEMLVWAMTDAIEIPVSQDGTPRFKYAVMAEGDAN